MLNNIDDCELMKLTRIYRSFRTNNDSWEEKKSASLLMPALGIIEEQ
jgi:hypothetical protein